MLFRNREGNLVEIKKNDYQNDKDYYRAIIAVKYHINNVKQNDKLNDISEAEHIANMIKTQLYM